jgi:hypothetical protein
MKCYNGDEYNGNCIEEKKEGEGKI